MVVRSPSRYREAMTIDVFAGVRVRDLERAVTWYSTLLGSAEAFRPNDEEAVWSVADHGHVYVLVDPDGAGHGLVTLFVSDLDAALATAAAGDLSPTTLETYENGVRKATFHDPDGNEIGLGGGPTTPPSDR